LEALSRMVSVTSVSFKVQANKPSLETKHFIYFYLGHNAILLFKTQ
jgi:hypothetical protein